MCSGGVDVPRATMLMVNLWPLNNDPEFWEDPTKFKSELFEAVKRRMEVEVHPLLSGRRQWPTASLAMKMMA
ncbi:hypothetical protein RJ639_021557 [Escallonia herrerae]|uniref:Uncharacterized protein n=1 Tax=Escallonia herrerae TaxID=1293975 RepID=A0AA89AFS5_9ASTE|nr:hypothetical protein RJ639_021557 [Escallonia herrerae]